MLNTAPGISDLSIGSISRFSLSSPKSCGTLTALSATTSMTLSILHDDDLLNVLDDGDNSSGRFLDLPPPPSNERWILMLFGSVSPVFVADVTFRSCLWMCVLGSRLCAARTQVRNTNIVSFDPNWPPVIHGLSFWLDDLSCFLALKYEEDNEVASKWGKLWRYLLHRFISYGHI